MDMHMAMMFMYTAVFMFICMSSGLAWAMGINKVKNFVLFQVAMLVGAVVVYFVKIGIGAAFA